ncbi:MAG: bifunctional YncE family protein/alkaline phosphatase family protein [Planctomycetota bacterium]|nr:bifunctional YncE family protein/alkaline phosphatase family protein [Planctomycetota bacterium]
MTTKLQKKKWTRGALVFCSLLFVAAPGNGSLQAQEKSTNELGKTSESRFPGPTENGYLLPNGWHITPAGRQIETTDLLLNIKPLKDSKHAIIATSGFNEHNVALVNLETGSFLAKESARQSWFGLAMSADEQKLIWSGGGAGQLHTFEIADGKLTRTSEKEPDVRSMKREEAAALKAQLVKEKSFRGGLCLDEQRQCVYSLKINAGKLAVIPFGGEEAKELDLGGRPYDVQLSPRNGLLYISDWSERRIVVVDPVLFRVVARIPVGEHPNQIAFHPTDDRLFVACASANGVWVIDTKRGIVTETIYTPLFPRAPEGSTPDALAVSPDGETLYVANADNNCIAVIEVEHQNKSTVKGFIPTGWYPTAVAVTPDGKNLLVGVGKGNQSKANPIPKVEVPDSKLTETEKVVKKSQPFPYIGTNMSGALSIVPIPDEAALKVYTQQVYRNCPYSDDLLTAVPNKVPTAIPTKVGDPSPIKYVIYVIKENRTYDQVFGDLATGDTPKGKGDPSLCMFPRNVTPNHHKLAEQFVLLDNLYCNGQVSRDGHPWSTMAYNTDYISRDWHLTYSQRLGVDDDDEGDLSNGPSGYLWDACMRAGVSYRNYKEYGSRVSDDNGNTKMEGRVPGLVGHMCPNFGIGKGRERDMDLIDVMLDEYKQFVENKNMPKFIMMSLGEDHTDGTRPGSFTPQACVGSNDIAIGKLVEAVSHGPLWAETAIFMIEDDAQNGPDHIDAHRTVSLVISPYTKRAHVDSTQYSTVSMIRTMELILGLEPLSQYDAAARPMFNSFTNVADLTPYTMEKAQINLEAKNDALAYGADRSMRMDFTEYDRIDDFELNEILWHSIMGEDAPLPPAVRRAIAFRSSNLGKQNALTP